MRKPLLPASVTVTRWIVAVLVLIALAVVVSGKNVSGNHVLPGHSVEMAAAPSMSQSQAVTPDTRARVRADFAALPLAFEANQGQTDARVKYMARGQGYQLFLTANEAVFAVHSSAPDSDTSAGQTSTGQTRAGKSNPAAAHLAATNQRQTSAETSAAIRMQFVGGNPRAQVAAGSPLPGTINYYIGNDPSKWQQGVKQYSAVIYRDVYPGVDVAFHGQQRQLEFDFIVAPGANPRPITASFVGARRIATDGTGNLLLSSAAGDVLLHKPVAYQEKNGNREPVDARFVLEAENRVRFELGHYDHDRKLVIDPSVSYATYLGGSAEDDGLAIAIDDAGAAYVTGDTMSTNFPTVNPEQANNAGGFDVFVTKFAPGGASLDYSTYVGGSGNDSGNAIAVNASTGVVYVAGGTSSGSGATTPFPTTPGALQTTYGGGNLDGFVFELSSSGGTLIYSTYLGGTGDDVANGLALDGNGNTYIVGSTSSTNFPISLRAIQTSLNGASNGFVTELNSTGSAPVVYSTFLGGGNGDLATAVAVDSSGNAYVTGITYNSGFPVQNAFQKACGSCTGGMSNAFVSVIQPGGMAFVYSTFLGGSSADSGLGIAVDSSQDAYVTGIAQSTNFPVQSAYQGTYGGGSQDAFVSAFNPSGGLLYSTYLGGSQNDGGAGIAVDGSQNVYVTGQTGSSNFPVTNATQSTIGGANDAFVTEINCSGSQSVFSTFLGGSQNEDSTTSGANLSPIGGITVDTTGANIYVAGNTFSSNFPTVSPEQPTIGGNGVAGVADAFVARYTQSSAGCSSFIVTNGTLSPSSGSPGVSATATITVTSRGGFSSAVTLACSVSPSVTNGPTCSFTNPGNSVTPPANGSATATLNVATTAASARLDRSASGTVYALLLPVGLALLGSGMGTTSSRRKKLFGWLMLGLLLGAVLLMPGCSGSKSSGGGGGGGTPANTYTITVTGTSGSTVVTGSPAITLTVN